MKKYIFLFTAIAFALSAEAKPVQRDTVPALYGFWNYVAKSGAYTMTADDGTIHCTSGTFTIDLPTAVGIVNRVYVFKNTGLGVITLDPAGSETIDGLTTKTVTDFMWIQSTGQNWIIICQ